MPSYFYLSGISGCIAPETGTTIGYDFAYNKDKIIAFYKKDYSEEFVKKYAVVVLFENYKQSFVFLTQTHRDNFYNSLKI